MRDITPNLLEICAEYSFNFGASNTLSRQLSKDFKGCFDVVDSKFICALYIVNMFGEYFNIQAFCDKYFGGNINFQTLITAYISKISMNSTPKPDENSPDDENTLAENYFLIRELEDTAKVSLFIYSGLATELQHTTTTSAIKNSYQAAELINEIVNLSTMGPTESSTGIDSTCEMLDLMLANQIAGESNIETNFTESGSSIPENIDDYIHIVVQTFPSNFDIHGCIHDNFNDTLDIKSLTLSCLIAAFGDSSSDITLFDIISQSFTNMYESTGNIDASDEAICNSAFNIAQFTEDTVNRNIQYIYSAFNANSETQSKRSIIRAFKSFIKLGLRVHTKSIELRT